MTRANIKRFFFSFSLILICSFNSFSQELPSRKDYIKHRLDSFLSTPRFSQYEGWTKEDVKALPKYDRPDLALEQDFYMTVNPYTLEVPSETKFHIMDSLKIEQEKNKISPTAIFGVDWDERGPNNVGGRTRALMFDPTDSANGYKKVWAAGVAGGLWYNSDITSSSSAWSNVDDFWDNLSINSIAYDPTDDSIFYIGTGEGWYNADAVRGQGIWKSTDAGATWSQLSATDNSSFHYVLKLAVTSTGRVLAATRGGLRYSDNGGTSWTRVQTGNFGDIEIAQNGDIYASKGNTFTAGAILKSTNNGTTWSTITPASPGNIRRVELACAPSDSNIVYAVAANSSYNVEWVKKSIDKGSTWINETVPSYRNDPSRDFTRGQAWYDLILAVHPTKPDELLIGGIDLHKSTDSGSTWTDVSHWYGGFSKPYVHADQHAIAYRPGDPDEVIFGNDGGVFYSHNAGSSTSPSFSSRIKGYNVTQFYALALENTVNSNYMLAGAQDNGTQRFNQADINTTREVTGGDGAYCFIDQNDSKYQITSYVRNNFRRSTNGGISFSNITSSNKGRFINPADYDDSTAVLYAASDNNKLFRIKGITGTLSNAHVTVGGDGLGNKQASHIRCSPYSADVLFVGNNLGDIYKVTDAQNNPISTHIDTNNTLPSGYISCIEVGSSDSQLLVTFTNYGVISVWETLDAGNTWVNKEGKLPDMPVRWAIYNPDNRKEVMLATEVGVWSTDDITASTVDWDPSNTGLANVRCDMLQLRPVDNLVAVATHGRGVYTSDVFAKPSCVASLDLGADTSICGDSLILSQDGYVEYVWNTGATDSSITLDSTGLYVLQVKDASGCVGRDSIEVNFFTIPEISLTDTSQCGGQVTITIDSFSFYDWSTGDTTRSINISQSGKYLVEVTDSNGCVAKDSADVEIYTIPDVSLNDSTQCGGSITLNAPAYSSFLWSTNQTSQQITVQSSGTYWVEVTDTNGCKSRDSVSIRINSLPQLDLKDTSHCGASIRISAGSFSGHLWSTGSTSSSISTTTSGQYWVEVTSDKGCKVRDTFQLTLYALPQVNMADVSQCEGSVLLIPGNYSDYRWNDGSKGNFLIVNTSGSYWVEVTDQNGCKDKDTAEVSIFTNPNVSIPDTNQCGGSITLDASNFMSYDWSTGARSAAETISKSGKYWVTVTDTNGCKDTDTANVEIFNLPSIKLPDTAQCGGMVKLGVAGFSSYEWSTGPSSPNISVSSSGSYWLKVTDANGCVARDTSDVTIYDLPSLMLINDTAQCGGDVLIDAGNHKEYSWNTGSTSNQIQVNNTGDYWVEVTDGNGCKTRDSVKVTIYSLPEIRLEDTTHCGESLSISPFVSGVISDYNWSNGVKTNAIEIRQNGLYILEVTDENGCNDQDSSNVILYPVQLNFLGEDTTWCVGDSIDAGKGTDYSWNTGATSRSIGLVTSGTYSVQKYDENGCDARDTTELEVIQLPIAQFIAVRSSETNNSFVVDFTNTSSDAVEFLWDFDNGETSEEENPTQTFDLGVYTVRLICSNVCGMDTLEQEVSYTASIYGLRNSSVKIYPNPTKNVVIVEGEIEQVIVSISVYDIYGKKVKGIDGIYKNRVRLNMTELASGTYHIVVETNTGVLRDRLILAK